MRKLVLAIWLAALPQVFVQPVHAEVRISGNVGALVLETREASVEEVLAALRTAFKLQFHTSGAVHRVMTGTYAGSLQQVVARLFVGQNYILRSSANGMEIAVFGPGAPNGNVVEWGRANPASASPVEPPAQASSPGGEGWNGALPPAPPRAPVAPPAKAAGGAAPPVLRPVVAAPAPAVPPVGTAPVEPSAAPAFLPPQPEPIPQIGQSNVEGWGG